MRKILAVYVIFGLSALIPANGQGELERLWRSAASSNAEVLEAEAAYDSSCLSSDTLGGIYAPSLSVSSSASIGGDYELWDVPKSFTPAVTFTQPLPGGTKAGITGSYSITSNTITDRQYVTQSPEISISLSQSLLPFWLQGKKRNPEKLSLEQKRLYNYYQLLYTRQQKIIATSQYYILCQIYRKKIQVQEASIAFRTKQVQAYNELRKAGKTSRADVTDLEAKLFGERQGLYEMQLTYEQYLESLRDACGTEADFTEGLSSITSVKQNAYLELMDGKKDPCALSLLANIEAEENERVLNAQKNSPVLNLSFTSGYTMEEVDADRWRDAWNDKGQKSWSAGISVDLAPLFSASASKSKKHDEIELRTARQSYSSYLLQRQRVRMQYESLCASFKEQVPHAEQLFREAESLMPDVEKRYRAGGISEIDYEGYKFQAVSAHASYDCLVLYVWLYEWLSAMHD